MYVVVNVGMLRGYSNKTPDRKDLKLDTVVVLDSMSKPADFGLKMSRITVRIRELGLMCICREWTYLAVVFTDDMLAWAARSCSTEERLWISCLCEIIYRTDALPVSVDNYRQLLKTYQKLGNNYGIGFRLGETFFIGLWLVL